MINFAVVKSKREQNMTIAIMSIINILIGIRLHQTAGSERVRMCM